MHIVTLFILSQHSLSILPLIQCIYTFNQSFCLSIVFTETLLNLTSNNNNEIKISWRTGASSFARNSTANSIDDFFTRFRSPSTFWGLAASGESFEGFAFLGTRVAFTVHQHMSSIVVQTDFQPTAQCTYPSAKVSEHVNRKCHVGNTITQLATPYTNPKPSNSPVPKFQKNTA